MSDDGFNSPWFALWVVLIAFYGLVTAPFRWVWRRLRKALGR